MGFLDDKEDKYINGAECERKQGNDDVRHCNNYIYRALDTGVSKRTSIVLSKSV